MNKPEKATLTLGLIGKTYGVQGWLKIYTYTQPEDSLLQYQPWYLISETDKEKSIIVELEKTKRHGNGFIVKFAGINSPEQARLLTGKKINVLRSQLPKLKKDEYYWFDLVGLTIINKNGQLLGKVIYLLETGSNDVLVIKGDKEFAIPYLVGDVIKHIDLDKQEILVDWEPL